MAVVAAVAEFAVADGEEACAWVGGAEPERGGVGRFGDVERGAEVVAVGAGEGEGITGADGCGEAGAGGRAVEGGGDAADGVDGAGVEGPVGEGARAGGSGLPADGGLDGGPRGIVEGGVQPWGGGVGGGGDFPAAGGDGTDEGVLGGEVSGAVGDVRALARVEGGEAAFDGSAVGLDEGEEFAGAVEGEGRVEGREGRGAVFSGAEDDETGTGGEGDGGEAPLAEVGGVVGKEPAVEGSGGWAGVFEFEPVRVVAIGVGEAAGVVGHEFGDAERGLERGCGEDEEGRGAGGEDGLHGAERG